MNITSASLGSGGTLNVQYAPNDTGAITGWTITPESGREDWSSGETITIRYVPQFSGTVLTETFTVSGVDEAGVERSDSSVLRQTYNTDLRLYFDNASPAGIFMLAGVILNSSAMTSNYIEANVTLTGETYTNYVQALVIGSSWPTRPPAIWYGHIGVPATSITLNVDSQIVNSGLATVTVEPAGTSPNLVFSSSDDTIASIDGEGVITVKKTGQVTFCVMDTVSELSDCKSVLAIYSDVPPGPEPPDTGITIDSIALIVPSYVYGFATASTVYSPSNAAVDLHYSSQVPSIAEIDEYTGVITVKDTGNVTICVTDRKSGLSDCKPINTETLNLMVRYKVDSRDESVKILNIPSAVTYAELDDGTPVPIDTHYTFPRTGYVDVYYILAKESDAGGGYNSQGQYIPQICSNTINYEAFRNCGKIVRVEIPEGVAGIGRGAFDYCWSMSAVTVPESVAYLYGGCFSNCLALTSVTIPGQLQYMWEDVFAGCDHLATASVKYPYYGEGSSYPGYDIPGFTFCGCTRFYNYQIPSNITRIREDAFRGAGLRGDLVLPETLVLIDGGAFQDCQSITSVTFPSSVEVIGGWAFSGCTGMQEMTFLSMTPPSLGTNPYALGEYSFTFPIYVPCEAVEDYKEAYPNYASRIRCKTPPEIYEVFVKYNVTSTTETTKIYTIDYCADLTTGITAIYYNGEEIPRSTGFTFPETGEQWLHFFLEPAVTPEGRKAIYNHMFHNCVNIVSAVFDDKFQALNIHCFQGCTNLRNVECWGVEDFGDYCFNNCEKLTSVASFENTVRIGYCAFRNTALSGEITFSTDLKNIDAYAFENTMLESVIIPDGVSDCYIGGNNGGSFYNCKKLKNLYLGNGFSGIQNSENFKYCALESVTLPDSMNILGRASFGYNNNLALVVIGSGITDISDSTFANCISLKKIYARRTTAPTVYMGTFYNVATGGTLYYPSGSTGYDTNWLKTTNYYLGQSNWTSAVYGSSPQTLSLQLSSTIVDYATATTVPYPLESTALLVYSSSDPSLAEIDPITGEIEVYGDGVVTFTVRDAYSSISDSVTVSVSSTTLKKLMYVMDVTSTTQSVRVASVQVPDSLYYVEIDDGTKIMVPPGGYSVDYTFSTTGPHTIYCKKRRSVTTMNTYFQFENRITDIHIPPGYYVGADNNAHLGYLNNIYCYNTSEPNISTITSGQITYDIKRNGTMHIPVGSRSVYENVFTGGEYYLGWDGLGWTLSETI